MTEYYVEIDLLRRENLTTLPFGQANMVNTPIAGIKSQGAEIVTALRAAWDQLGMMIDEYQQRVDEEAEKQKSIYPKQDGDITVLAPGIIIDKAATVVSVHGENYYRHPDPVAQAFKDDAAANPGTYIPPQQLTRNGPVHGGFTVVEDSPERRLKTPDAIAEEDARHPANNEDKYSGEQ